MTATIDHETMFNYATNAGAFYPEFCAAAREGRNAIWWKHFIRTTALNGYRREFHAPRAEMTEWDIARVVCDLASYYGEHVAA